jgi:integral membrane protein
MSGALVRYRVLAWIVGVLLIVLVCIGVPLKYAADIPEISKWVGFVHGVFFYPLYLIVTLDLARRVHMPPLRTLLTMVAGTVPGLSFVAERATTRWVQQQQAMPAASDAGAAAQR